MKGDNEKEVFNFFRKKRLQERKGEKGTFLLPLHKPPTKKNQKTKKRERKEPIFFLFRLRELLLHKLTKQKTKGRGVGRMGLVLGGGGEREWEKIQTRGPKIFFFGLKWGFFLRAKPRIDQMGLVHW